MEEIDIIELLKRVKEGNAPKEIEINGNKYQYDGTDNIQYAYQSEDYCIFVENITLDTKIKILDKPTIEKLDYSLEELEETSYNESWLMNCIRDNKEKINEIIRYLRSRDER